jgi:hypothetical protein
METQAAVETTPQPLHRKITKVIRKRTNQLMPPGTAGPALKQAVIMLRPDIQWTNPVMFVVELGAFLTLLFVVQAAFGHSASQIPITYFIALDVWLFLTVLFANFATALVEARGKAQAESLRRTRRDTVARRLSPTCTIEEVSSTHLKLGDTVVVEAGEIIPGDGEIIKGIASVDESAITGESAPVIRESGGDRSGVTGGTRVLSDRIVVRITTNAGESFLDRMIALVEGAVAPSGWIEMGCLGPPRPHSGNAVSQDLACSSVVTGITVINCVWVKFMWLGKLTIFLVVALAAFQAQCLVACPAYASSDSPSNQNVPPCHRHHNNPQTPAPCSHQAVSTTVASPSLKYDLGPTASAGILGLVTPSFELFVFALGDYPFERTVSPPPLISQSSSALRI